MRHMKGFQLFESVGQTISDILLEINDDEIWDAKFWKETLQFNGWVVIIDIVDNYKSTECKTLSTDIIEVILRTIDFMNMSGFAYYKMTFDYKDNQGIGDGMMMLEYQVIDISDLKDLIFWSNNFIRIDFKKR